LISALGILRIQKGDIMNANENGAAGGIGPSISAPLYNMRAQGGRTVIRGDNMEHTSQREFTAPSFPSTSRAIAKPAGTVTIRMDLVKQTMEGIGYSNAFYTNWWQTHPKKNEIFSLMFTQLQPTIIRLRNSYELEDMSPAEMQIDSEFVQTAKAMLGYTPKILLVAWTPPASLKVSGTLLGATDGQGKITGTLSKDGRGWFQYYALAVHWTNSLDAYAKLNIFPDFIR
jgi:hypothetical protein